MTNEYFKNQLSIFDLIPDNEDKCDSCLFCEDCYKFNVIRFDSCINYSNYIPKVEAPQFPESDFAEIVNYINNKLGLNFIRSDWQPEGDKAYYHCKVNKNLKLNLSKSRFAEGVNDEREYIGVGWDIKTGGGGSPVDTVGEALDYFEDVLSKYK